MTSGLSLAIGAVAALVGKRVPASPRRVEIADRATVVGLAAAVLAGSIAFVAVAGNPVDWIDKRVSQLSSGKDANLSSQSSRFSTLNAATAPIASDSPAVNATARPAPCSSSSAERSGASAFPAW